MKSHRPNTLPIITAIVALAGGCLPGAQLSRRLDTLIELAPDPSPFRKRGKRKSARENYRRLRGR